MEEQKKPRIRIMGDTVYEINRRTKKIEGVFHGVKQYFESRRDDDDESEELIEEEPSISTHTKYKNLKNLARGAMGNKRRLAFTSEADGLDRDIPIVEIEEEPEKKKDRLFRKKKSSKPKQKRKIVKKIKKCRCK